MADRRLVDRVGAPVVAPVQRAVIGLYERYGFEQTGEIVFDDEVLLRLALR